MNKALWDYVMYILTADQSALSESQRKHAAFWRDELNIKGGNHVQGK